MHRHRFLSCAATALLALLVACGGSGDANSGAPASGGGSTPAPGGGTTPAPGGGTTPPPSGGGTNPPPAGGTTPVLNGSAGCGTPARFASGRYSLTSEGVKREFLVSMPARYDAKTALPLVVGLHWRGGNASNVGDVDYYGLRKLYGDAAIFVAPEGLDAGWANYNDRDIKFVRAMVEQLQGGLCIDKTRVFATGFSFGGMMSNAIGCQMGDTFRAVAPIAGSLWSGCAESTNRVGAILIHAQADNVVGYQFGEEARDKYVQRNACTKTTRSIGRNGCVEYTGCDSKYPVVWCGYPNGQHWMPDFAGTEIKAFFDRF